MRSAPVVVSSLLLFLVSSVGSGQAPSVDTEKMLVERFGFTAVEVQQARAGQAVVKTQVTEDPVEIAVLGAIRIPDDPQRLVYWLRDIEGFRKAAELGAARKLSSPPRIEDFADLALEPAELAAIQKCKPADCDLRLGDRGMARFQTKVDWAAPDASRLANAEARQMMLEYAQAYLRGGDEALGAVHNEREPRVVAEEFRTLIWKATNLYQLAYPFANYLEKFPKAELPGAEPFLYWAKGGLGSDPVLTLHHVVIYEDPTMGPLVGDKQLYASRDVDASALLLWLSPAADGQSYYLLAGGRARSRRLDGFAARVLRGRVEAATRETTAMYLEWLYESLSMR